MKPIIDISHHQNPGLIDYDKLASQIDGVIIRAAYGNKPDTAFEQHYEEFNKRGVPIGVYQFITEYMPVEEQVQTLYEMVMQDKNIPLGFWADVENETGADSLTKQTVHTYMQQVEALLGKEFGIYTSASQWAAIMGGTYYTNRKLWVAHYGTAYPALPMGWKSFWLWQYTSSKRLEGYAENLDANAFCCDDSVFQQWIGGVSLPEPEPLPSLRLFSPVARDSWISQRFGINPQWYSAARGHNGIDYGIIVGSPVYAAMDGIVEVSLEQKTGYGRHIRIRHPEGVTIYGHLSKRMFEVGDFVMAKQLIGRSGGALDDPYCGMSTGPHLHFEYRQDKPVVPLVPGSYIYNAIDTLPFTLYWEQELGEMLYQVEVVAAGLNVRKGIGTGYDIIRTESKGAILSVYEVTNGWFKIGEGQWVSGYATYTKRIIPAGEPTTEEKVGKLWIAHPDLH